MNKSWESYLNTSPHELFDKWYDSAIPPEGKDVCAMSLATADAGGMPQVRTVLLKAHANGQFVFYTNNESRKGQALQVNPHQHCCFFGVYNGDRCK